jgi:CRP/FNR family transcriptional regulator, cyclic AMP receptor protein
MTLEKSALDGQLVQRLLEHCHRHIFPAKATIIRQGSPTGDLFYLLSGSVTVLIEDELGHEFVLAYLYPGEFFGEIGLFNQELGRTAVVRARRRCEVAQISYSRLRALPDIFVDLLIAMSGQLANRLRSANLKLSNLVFMDVSGRIARTLIDLCHEPDAVAHPQGMQVRITRQELGRVVGCSREMVGRVLKEMEARHLIGVQGKTILVFGAALRRVGS